jgi:hypothetical protein
MRKLLLFISMSVGLVTLPATAFAQAGTAVETCSEAYDFCFNACVQQFPGGTDASAKCIDKCVMSRAKCDRNGCFTSKAISVCGLAKE